MKKMLLIAILFITGCAMQQVQELRTWVNQTKPLAQSGEMLWSDYYLQFYDKVNALPPNIEGRGFYLQAAAIAIDTAKSYENGKISQDEFESFRRQLTAQEAEYTEQMNRMNRQAAAQAYSQYLQNQAAQAAAWRNRQPTYQIQTPTRCTSQRFGDTVNTTCY